MMELLTDFVASPALGRRNTRRPVQRAALVQKMQTDSKWQPEQSQGGCGAHHVRLCQ